MVLDGARRARQARGDLRRCASRRRRSSSTWSSRAVRPAALLRVRRARAARHRAHAGAAHAGAGCVGERHGAERGRGRRAPRAAPPRRRRRARAPARTGSPARPRPPRPRASALRSAGETARAQPASGPGIAPARQRQNASSPMEPGMALQRRQREDALGLARRRRRCGLRARPLRRARRRRAPRRCRVFERDGEVERFVEHRRPCRDRRAACAGGRARPGRRRGWSCPPPRARRRRWRARRPAASAAVHVAQRLPGFHVAGQAIEVVGAREGDAFGEVALGGGELVQLARGGGDHHVGVGDAGAAVAEAARDLQALQAMLGSRARSR